MERQSASQKAMADRSEAKRVAQEARVAAQEAEENKAIAKQAVDIQERQVPMLQCRGCRHLLPLRSLLFGASMAKGRW